MAFEVRIVTKKRIGVDAVQWNGDNGDDLFDYARPLVFQNYAKPDKPMMARTAGGLKEIQLGEWIEKWEVADA